MASTSTKQQQQQLQLRTTTLPHDILQNILSRLPVKTLMRFRCLSKSINSLLRNPHFVKLHLHMAHTVNTKTRVLVTTDPPQIITPPDHENAANTLPIEYPSLIFPDIIEIIGSCNGLLCFMVAHTFSHESTDYRFVLWNPSTRVSRELAKPDPLLANYPDVIPIYGFGYDSTTGDYKVIRAVSPFQGTTSTDLEIYNLRDNVWRKKRASLPCVLTAEYWRSIEDWFPGIFSRGAGLYANGAVHWLEKRHTKTSDTHESAEIILSFNLATEEFEEVIPILDYNKDQDSCLGELRVLGGDLSILVKNWKTCEIEIWVMKEYGAEGSWTKITTMPDSPGPEFVDSFMGDWFIPFCSCGNGCLLVDMDGSEVLLYNPQGKTFSKIELGDNKECFLVQDFVETLVSPHDV